MVSACCTELLCVAGKLAETSIQSAHELRRKRNPRHVLRFPGGPPITAEMLQATPLSAILKAKKVPTRVVGRAKRTFAPITGANASALMAKYQAATAAAAAAATAAGQASGPAQSAAGGASNVPWQELDDTVLGPHPPPL